MNFDINRYTKRSLVPCPICHKTDFICTMERETIFRKKLYKVNCISYGCYDTQFVVSFNKDKAIDKWNKRAKRLYRITWHNVKW